MKRLYKHIMLSIMPTTRERQSHFAGREAHRRRDPCAGKPARHGIRDLHRKYAGGSEYTCRLNEPYFKKRGHYELLTLFQRMISSVTWFTDKSSQRLRLDRIALQFYKIIIIPLQGGFPTNIRPSAAIRQNYNEITALFRSTQPPFTRPKTEKATR